MSVNSKAAPVRFKNVTKIYGKDVLAVDDINLKIEAGKLAVSYTHLTLPTTPYV